MTKYRTYFWQVVFAIYYHLVTSLIIGLRTWNYWVGTKVRSVFL